MEVRNKVRPKRLGWRSPPAPSRPPASMVWLCKQLPTSPVPLVSDLPHAPHSLSLQSCNEIATFVLNMGTTG